MLLNVGVPGFVGTSSMSRIITVTSMVARPWLLLWLSSATMVNSYSSLVSWSNFRPDRVLTCPVLVLTLNFVASLPVSP